MCTCTHTCVYVDVWGMVCDTIYLGCRLHFDLTSQFLKYFLKFFMIDKSSNYFRVRINSKKSVITHVYDVYLRVCVFTWLLHNTSLAIPVVYLSLLLPHLKIRKINVTFYLGVFQIFPFQIRDLREETFILRYIFMGLSQCL